MGRELNTLGCNLVLQVTIMGTNKKTKFSLAGVVRIVWTLHLCYLSTD